jgi:hypothetical protein
MTSRRQQHASQLAQFGLVADGDGTSTVINQPCSNKTKDIAPEKSRHPQAVTKANGQA